MVPLDAGDPAPAASPALPPVPAPAAPAAVGEVESPQGITIDISMLSLAPPGGFLEEPPPSVSLELDISYLSLVPGYDWTLEDCDPPPTPIPLPDLSYLTLVPLPESEPQRNEVRYL